MDTTETPAAASISETRPWGRYTVIDAGHEYQVKRLEVLPGERMSYQKHERRSEHWTIVQGTAKITLEGKDLIVPLGGSMDVPVGTAHRIANPGRELLVMIEIQRGSYLGEDDIIRLQDDYGRVTA